MYLSNFYKPYDPQILKDFEYIVQNSKDTLIIGEAYLLAGLFLVRDTSHLVDNKDKIEKYFDLGTTYNPNVWLVMRANIERAKMNHSLNSTLFYQVYYLDEALKYFNRRKELFIPLIEAEIMFYKSKFYYLNYDYKNSCKCMREAVKKGYNDVDNLEKQICSSTKGLLWKNIKEGVSKLPSLTR